jgi:serine/threonine protein kinase
MALAVLAIPTVGLFIRRQWKKYYNAKVEVMEEEYHLLDDDYQETKINFVKTKQKAEDLQLRWLVNYDDITFDKVIGKGSFGEVWRGHWQSKTIAVKKMFPEPDAMMAMPYDSHATISINNTTNTQDITQVALDMLNNLEVGAMMSLRHEHIIDFEGAGQMIAPPLDEWETEPRVGIFVMLEYAAGGDLTHRLQNAAGSLLKFPWKDRVQCASDIASGMSFLHSKGFIHRDLKSMNVLCDKHGKCMIADLGLARKLERAADADAKVVPLLQNVNGLNERKYEGATSWAGTAAWMAPEVTGYYYGLPVDVFSFGVVMWELLTCRIPWAGSSYNFTHLIIRAVVRGERPEVTQKDLKDVPDGFVKLMKQCWHTEPKERPTFKKVMSILTTFNNVNSAKGSMVANKAMKARRNSKTISGAGTTENEISIELDESTGRRYSYNNSTGESEWMD